MWPLSMLAQSIPEADGGARAEAGIDLRLELDNGDPEFRTGFDLDLITATRTQRLSFSGDFGLTVPLDDVESANFSDPSYGIDYLRDNGRSRVTFSANYSQSDVDRIREEDDDPDAEFDEDSLIISEDGTRERIRAQATLEVGQNDPIGATLSYSFDETSYSGVTDPDLVDERADDIGATVRFDIDPTLQFSLNGSWGRAEIGGLFPREEITSNVGASVAWEVQPELTLNASISRLEITTDTTIFGVTTRSERDGVNLTFGASLDRPNGAYTFDASRTQTTVGYVNRVELTRSLELARGGNLSLRIGATELPSGAVEPVGGLTFSRETGRGGELDLSLSVDATLNRDNEEVRRTILTASYGADLPQDAGWSLSGRLTESDFITGTDADVASARVAVGYNRPLTEDWGLGAGVSWQLTREDGAADDIDNRVFLSLERRFTLRR